MTRFSNMLYMLREGDYLGFVIMLASTCFVIFCCLPMHELAHAVAADKLGDDTARLKGRISLNPLAHLDLMGTVMILLFGIGYANPVPVNPSKLKHPRRDMAIVSLAGPASNLIMGFLWAFLSYIITAVNSDNVGLQAIAVFFYYAASINVTLAVFNLLPIPPLDGSKIYSAILPDKIYFKIMKYDKYIMIALFVLLLTGALSSFIGSVSNAMMWFITIIPRAIFG